MKVDKTSNLGAWKIDPWRGLVKNLGAKAQIKKLRNELRYFQERAQIEARALKAARDKCKEIGAKMRAIQQSQKGNRS